jgi:hypothetical protein
MGVLKTLLADCPPYEGYIAFYIGQKAQYLNYLPGCLSLLFRYVARPCP